jgi:hypothetical protein
MAKQTQSIFADMGGSPELLQRIAAHADAVKVWEAAQSNADRCWFRAKKHLPKRPDHLAVFRYISRPGETAAPLTPGLLKRFSVKLDRSGLRAVQADLRKVEAGEAKILRAHGWLALDKIQRKAGDAMDAAELRCTRFRARSVGDLAVKLQFAADQYGLADAGIDGLAVASVISDAVRLAKKGGAA